MVLKKDGTAERLTTAQYKLRKAAKIDGDEFFDSIAEFEVYKIFLSWVEDGSIFELVRQPSYVLLETTRINGITYHKTEYVADFEYKIKTEDGFYITIVTDVKGFPTAEAKLKAKMFRIFYQGTHRLDWVKYTKSRGIELMEYGKRKPKNKKAVK